MAQVTFPPEIGGSGATYSDDANPNTGMANGGHRTRLVPMLAQVVAVASWMRTTITNTLTSISNSVAAVNADAQQASDAADTAVTAAGTATGAATSATNSAASALTSRNEAQSFRDQAEAITGFNPNNINITGGGLLAGQGGNLTASRTFTLNEISIANAIAGVGTDLVTGRRLASALQANARTLDEEIGIQWFFS